MDILSTLSVMLGSSWISGLNAYAAIGFLGLFGRMGWIHLPESLHPLTHPAVFGIALFFYLVEFIADKIPAFDSFWDSIQTFFRIPAGALMAYGAVGDVSPELKVISTIVGGTLALTAHTAKSSLRAVANMAPEPVSNWFLSFGQDFLVLSSIWLMFQHPWAMLAVLFVFLIFFIWFIPKIFRLMKWVFQKMTSPFRKTPSLNDGKGAL
ncbi:MAG: DUF4126 domain-containing protein [Deltaproteobacteria bacterium]|nr:DUF4126 domain-containing protein [Deltaproteobacteria bacterium]